MTTNDQDQGGACTAEYPLHSQLQFFRYEHLSERLQVVSKPFGDLARQMVATLPENPEKTNMLRKLLEAKDCAVRAQLFETDYPKV